MEYRIKDRVKQVSKDVKLDPANTLVRGPEVEFISTEGGTRAVIADLQVRLMRAEQAGLAIKIIRDLIANGDGSMQAKLNQIENLTFKFKE